MQAAQGRIEQTVGYSFSFDEGTDVGMDLATPVTEEYPMQDNAFTGVIHAVTFGLGGDDFGHLLDPEMVFAAQMAAQ